MTFLPMVAIFVVFYFLLIRPQQKKAKEAKAMLEALQKGDEVVTAGGVLGRIAKLGDQYRDDRNRPGDRNHGAAAARSRSCCPRARSRRCDHRDRPRRLAGLASAHHAPTVPDSGPRPDPSVLPLLTAP